MSNRRKWTLAVAAVLATLIAAAALADRITPTTLFHSASTTVVTSSQLVSTTTMQQRNCVGWLFQNLDDVDTVYLNVNNNSTAAVASSYADQVVIPPGETVELGQHSIRRFQAISDDSVALYWSAICHSN